jgi:hypothetical protein
MDMKPSTHSPPPASAEPSDPRPPRTEEEEIEELMASMESMILPRALDVPESWKQFAGRLRTRLSRRAAHPH